MSEYYGESPWWEATPVDATTDDIVSVIENAGSLPGVVGALRDANQSERLVSAVNFLCEDAVRGTSWVDSQWVGALSELPPAAVDQIRILYEEFQEEGDDDDIVEATY